MQKEQMNKILRRYLCKQSFYPFFWTIVLVAGGIVLFRPYNSPHAILNKGKLILGTIILLPYMCIRYIRLFKIVLDLITGCRVKTYVGICSDTGVRELLIRNKKSQYHAISFETLDHRKKTLLLDEKFCKNTIVRGNVHTIQALRFSNFVLDIKHGKQKESNSTTEE